MMMHAAEEIAISLSVTFINVYNNYGNAVLLSWLCGIYYPRRSCTSPVYLFWRIQPPFETDTYTL